MSRHNTPGAELMATDTYPAHPGGNMLDYVNTARYIEWRPNEPFTATLRLVDMFRGRSSVKFHWVDDTGRRWSMFPKEMLTLVANSTIINGAITGRWQVIKRGANYGITRLDDE